MAGKTEETPPETAAAGVLANEYLPGKGGINQDYPETGPGQGGINQGYPETGTVDDKPDHIFAKALQCFNEKKVSYLSIHVVNSIFIFFVFLK